MYSYVWLSFNILLPFSFILQHFITLNTSNSSFLYSCHWTHLELQKIYNGHNNSFTLAVLRLFLKQIMSANWYIIFWVYLTCLFAPPPPFHNRHELNLTLHHLAGNVKDYCYCLDTLTIITSYSVRLLSGKIYSVKKKTTKKLRQVLLSNNRVSVFSVSHFWCKAKVTCMLIKCPIYTSSFLQVFYSKNYWFY